MYNVSRNGAEIGKYPKEEITDGLMTRFFLPTDHCWKPGMTEWKLLIVEFAAPADPTLPPPPPAPPVRRPDAAGIPTPSTSYQPVAQPQAPQKLSEWGKAWLLGGFLMPYIFAWRIIFDRTYGFTRTTKIIYSVWTACFFLSIINALWLYFIIIIIKIMTLKVLNRLLKSWIIVLNWLKLSFSFRLI